MSKYDVFSCHECHLKWHSQICHKSHFENVTKTGDISSDIADHILKCIPCHILKRVDISITSYPSLSHCHLDMNCHSSCRVLFTCSCCDTTESGRPPRARFISEGIGVWFWRHQLHGVIFMTKKTTVVTIFFSHIWQCIFQLVPKISVTPVEHNTGLQVQP